jgi:hypothetical protein
MDKESRTKLKLYGLFGLIIAWRTWGHFNSSIKFSDPYVGKYLTMRISITILLLVIMILILTGKNQIARRALQGVTGLFILTTVISFFVAPFDIYSTADFVRHGFILILYGYLFYFLQSRDMTDFMKLRRQGTEVKIKSVD